MSINESERTILLHEIQAWREAADAHAKGSPQYREFQNKMKLAEWKLNGLGPSQESPGLTIKIVPPEQSQE